MGVKRCVPEPKGYLRLGPPPQVLQAVTDGMDYAIHYDIHWIGHGAKAMSKRVWLIGMALLLGLVAAHVDVEGGQVRVENPARALAKDAGRVVTLEEVLRIRDDGDTVIFRSPRFFSLGPDGSLFFVDFAEGDRLYHFDAAGRFVRKLLKSGQGPGECQFAAGHIVAGDRVRVLSWVPPKIMDFDLRSGRYLKEARVEEDAHGLWFLGTSGGRIFGIRDEVFRLAAFESTGVFAVPNVVYEISPDFRVWKKLYEFPVRMMIKNRSAFRLDPIGASLRGTALYINHTAEYRVTQVDLVSGAAVRHISRAYDRIRPKPAKGDDADPELKGVDLPDDPYVWDIDKIHGAAGKLWVFTSHMKPDADDQQVDVFDAEGRYVDMIVLRYPAGKRNHRAMSRWTLLTDDGRFVIPEQEEDGLVTVGVYRVPDAGLFPK